MTAAALIALADARREEALANARAVIRSAPGDYPDPALMDACDYLMTHGDGIDWRDAQLVRSAITSQPDPSAIQQILAALAMRGLFGALGDAVGLSALVAIGFGLWAWLPALARAIFGG